MKIPGHPGLSGERAVERIQKARGSLVQGGHKSSSDNLEVQEAGLEVGTWGASPSDRDCFTETLCLAEEQILCP